MTIAAATRPPEPTPPGRATRPLRKAAAQVAGCAFGAYNALSAVPTGVAEGLTQALRPGASMESRRALQSKVTTLTHVAAGAAIGAALGGPVGLVGGAAVGYIGSAIGTLLGNRSSVSERLIERIDEKVGERIQGQASGFRRALTAAGHGAWEAVKDGWRQGKMQGGGMMAGAMDGLSHVADQIREGPAREDRPAEPQANLGLRIARSAMGVLGGVAGVMINAPGGIVLGAIGSVETSEEERARLARPLLLFATNLGKVILPTAVGAALGGPVGAAIGTGIGLITGSLTSIIDGRFGINKRIAGRVSQALSQVHGHEEASGYGVYHRAGKGIVAGAYAGIKEGWTLGSRSGRQFVDDLVYVPIEVAGEPAEDPRRYEEA